MTNLNKYRRQNHNLLSEENIEETPTQPTAKTRKRVKKYVEKITINLTQEEANLLNNMNEESGIPKGEIIRRELKKSGLFQ
jgi:hypothetical protein